MSSLQLHMVTGRRLWTVGLTAAALAVAATAPSAALAAASGKQPSPKAQIAQGTPDQVIDAKTNPDAAADALNAGCAVKANCSWKSNPAPNGATSPLTYTWGPPAVLGDVLYNCSPDEYAETAVGIKDERQESTSVSERVSLKVELNFLDLEDSSVEFSAFSSQSESFGSSVTNVNAVAIPPMYKGWTVTQIRSGVVTGSAYITSGIDKLIQVSDIDLNFPGYQEPGRTPEQGILYVGFKEPMTADDIQAACDTSTLSGAAALRKAQAGPRKFKLRLCGRSGPCRSREVTGSPPVGVRRATALLTRAGRAYGRGTYARGRTRLDVRRPLPAGKYRLTLRERPPAAQRTGRGALHAIKTIVPITVT